MHQAHYCFYYLRPALFPFLIIVPVKNSEFLRTPCIALFLKLLVDSLLRLSKVFHQFGYHAHHRCHCLCRTYNILLLPDSACFTILLLLIASPGTLLKKPSLFSSENSCHPSAALAACVGVFAAISSLSALL